MSLVALADHMASKGRGGDSMLVHMTPGEVQALQALAERHGKTLTINPETGQPEAFSLKRLLPALAGFALNMFAPGLGSAIGSAIGTSAAVGTGIAVGGLTTLATGSLSRGLMAGMGAYGGAGLAEGLAGAGAGAAQEAALAGLSQEQIASQAAAQGLTEQGVRNQIAADAVKEFAAKSATDRMGEGIASTVANPKNFMQGMGGGMKAAGTLYAAATPVLADQMVPTTTKAPDQNTGNIRKFSYDPYGQTYTPLGVYPAKDYKGMAGGGIVALADGGMSVEELYKTYAGRDADPGGAQYWSERFGSSVDPTEAAAFKSAIAEARSAGTEPMMAQPAAAAAVENMYRNVLGRDVEQSGLDYWTQQLQQAADPSQVYQAFLTGAQANKELGRFGTGFEQAVTPYAGYTSSDSRTYADEWVRNVLGREVTAADRQQPWYQQLSTTNTPEQTQRAYEDFLRSTGAQPGMSVVQASQLKPFTPKTVTAPTAYAPPGTTNPYGNGITPGDITRNADGTITTQPNIPGRPYGGFTGIQQLKDAYTAGGGSLGQQNLYVPATLAEFQNRYTNTGGSQQAYDYLMGKGAADIKKPYTPTGELMLPYNEAVMGVPGNVATKKLIFDPISRTYKANPDYKPLSYDSAGKRIVGASSNEIAGIAAAGGVGFQAMLDSGAVTYEQVAAALGTTVEEARKRFPKTTPLKDAAVGFTGVSDGGGDAGVSAGSSPGASSDGSVGGGNAGSGGTAADGTGDSGPGGVGGWAYGGRVRRMALGGLGALAGGGQAGYNLGSYSDGGRLLKGPGDGVSDSIPATIGDKQPARLADGEFVVPARIVSELGNGSTDAGARKLYAMMDRVQRARGKTTGKGKVAKNTRADKHLPA